MPSNRKTPSSEFICPAFTVPTKSSPDLVADVPAVDPDKIKARLNDFRDLAIYEGLAEYILPIVADFGNEENAERQKMGYYKNKAESLFAELITAGDWYDFDGDNTIESSEKDPGQINLRRIR